MICLWTLLAGIVWSQDRYRNTPSFPGKARPLLRMFSFCFNISGKTFLVNAVCFCTCGVFFAACCERWKQEAHARHRYALFCFFLSSFDTYCDGFNPLYMECLIAPFHFYICNISFSIDLQIVEGYASRDAVFTQGLICATGHVAPAVWDASACLLGPQGTEKCVGHAILTWPPMGTRPSALRTKNRGLWVAFCLGFSFQLLSNQMIIMCTRDAADSACILAFVLVWFHAW
jgi:hypothetical protein